MKDLQKIKEFFSKPLEEDAVDTITMDIPLFLRMLEYSREDASQDMDLHDVTEKANTLGKERGILTMDDYDAIVGAAEEIKEVVNYSFRHEQGLKETLVKRVMEKLSKL